MGFNTPSLLWFLAGIVLFLLELSVPGFVLFFFAAGAWLTSAVTLMLDLTLNSQILIFIISSVLSLLVLRRFVKKAFAGSKDAAGEDNVFAEAGMKVEVVSDIKPPAEGKVKYSGTNWRAAADVEISAGEIVEVVRQDGLLIMVKKIEG